MRIVFMGTPEFAVPTLQKLLNSAHKVVAVYSQPPRPAHRGQKEQPSPIHALAESHHIPVHTPLSLKGDEEAARLKAYAPDVVVVVAYGLLLPQSILDIPTHGCINVHPSKLPRWRGAAPIQHTILAGDADTSVCIIQMEKGLDSGPILAEKPLALHPRITASELHDLAAEIGGDLVQDVLAKLPNIPPRTQPSDGLTYASKLKKEDSIIDWNKSSHQIDCQIRALNPWPGTTTTWNGETIKILSAHPSSQKGTPGTVIASPCIVACGEGALEILSLQRAGKKALSAEEFVRGTPLVIGTIFGAI